MRIAIDARELTGKPTGVGRILASVLDTWSTLPAIRAHELILCLPHGSSVAIPRGLPAVIATSPGQGTWWQQAVLPRLLRRVQADLLYAPAYGGPILTRVPTVVSMFDVSFAAHPEWFSPRERLVRSVIARISARRAARVLTCSAFSRREIVRHLGVDAGAVEVIYPGLTVLPGTTPAYGSDDQSQRLAAPLVLYAGSIFNRRHVPELIAGFQQLARRAPHARLAIVGENRTTPRIDVERMIASGDGAERIEARSYVPDEELAELYRRAAAFVFCSDYEGFGMTPLEALAAGIPIIVLDTEVTREVYGPAAHYIARPDPQLIAAALERVLFDAGERQRILAAAPGVLARYSWEECGRRTLQVLLAAAS